MSNAPNLFIPALFVLLAWGALAFGAEYSWAYAPLLVLCVLVWILGARLPKTEHPVHSSALRVALIALLIVSAASLLPASRALRVGVIPNGAAVDYGRLFTTVTQQSLSQWTTAGVLSIAPGRTLLGLTFLVCLTALLAGCTRAFSVLGPSAPVRGIAVLGGVAAVIGIIHARFQLPLVYGFWRPPNPLPASFGPFVNKNHFAGWTVMVMALLMGWFTGCVATRFREARPGWRNRVLWFASADGSEVVLIGIVIGLMALSVVMTLSRGALLGLATALVLHTSWLVSREPSRARRLIGGGFMIAVFAAAAIRGGVGQTVDRFANGMLNWGGRRDIWRDASHILRDYPLTGTGLNTFGIAMLHYQSEIARQRVIEAHNDYLQLAAEGGLLLGIPIAATLGLLAWEIRCRFSEGADDIRSYWLRSGAVTGLAAIAVMEFFDFTLQMPGAAVMFIVLVAIAIHRPNYLRRKSTRVVA